MLKVKGTTIETTQGDTLPLNFIFSSPCGTPYILREGDSFWFSMKRNTKDNEYIVEPIQLDSNMQLEIPYSITKDWELGQYYYDIQLLTREDKKFTPLIGRIIVTDDVTEL